MNRTGSMRSRVGPAVTTTLSPCSSPTPPRTVNNSSAICAGSSMRPTPTSPQACSPLAGPSTRTPRSLQHADVRLCRGIRPHLSIHRRRKRDLRGSCEAERRQQVVGEAVRKPGDELGSRRRDDDLLRPPRKFDVPHRSLGALVPQIGPHRLAGHGLKSERGYELLGAARHNDLNFRASFDEATHQVRAFVGGDAAGHAEQNLSGLRTHGDELWARLPSERQTTATHIRIPLTEWRLNGRKPAAFPRKSAPYAGSAALRCTPDNCRLSETHRERSMSIRDWPAGERPREKLLAQGANR